ncbi:MAG: exodeoxyribonuclease V subunit gamma [Fibrobacterales bacterium]
MAINLFFSNDTMQLFDKLRDNYQPDDIFNPDPILVGGQMGTWLQYHMAQRDGIVGNLNVGRLEKNLWRILQDIDTFEGGSAEPLNKASLSLFVVHALMDSELMAKPVYEPLKKYLGGAEKNESLYFRKMMQLATQIATVFIDYEFKRIESPSCSGVIESWLDTNALLFSENIGKGVRPDEETWFGQVELWQKELYRELFTEEGILDRYSLTNSDWYCSLPMYARQVFKGEVDASSCTGETWHIFAMSQISLFHRRLIFKLSEMGVTFNVYALNPCADFWEDLVSQKNRVVIPNSWNELSEDECRVLTKEPAELGDETLREEPSRMHPLLAEWGRPGREGIQLWCQATDYAFSDRYSEPDAEGPMLERLQHSLLYRTTDCTKKKYDGSLQFWSAPEIKREVETLYDSIVHTLRLNSKIRFHDIAVFVTDLDRYGPIIQQVFDARNSEGSERIPFSLIDGTASSSMYSQAVRDLMALTGGSFTRKDIITFFENPCVQAARGITPEMVTIFVTWAERLNIFRHFDQTHRESAGYAEEYIHTWRMALDRLLLGQVVAAETVIIGSEFSVEAYSDIDAQNKTILTLFVETLEQLFRDGALVKKQKSVSEWMRILPHFFTTWCTIPDDMEPEKKVRDSFFEEMSKVVLLQKKSTTISWPLIQEFLSGLLSDLSGFGGSYLTGGVTVTSLSPKPPVPYECIYLLGLNEGVFPSRMTYSSLDLRGCRREIGDFSPIETDRYLFLEILTSVKKQLVLSYVATDIKKDEPLQQSSLLSELREFCDAHLLDTPLRECRIPLLSFDKRLFAGGYTQPLVPSADESCWIVPSYAKPQATITQLLEEQKSPTVSEYKSTSVELTENATVTESQLKRFIDNPLVYRLQQKYGLWGDEEEYATYSDEPLSVDMLMKGGLKGNILESLFSKWFGDGEDLGAHGAQEIVAEQWSHSSRVGAVPTAVLGALAKEEMQRGVVVEIERLQLIQKTLEEYEYLPSEKVVVECALPGQDHLVTLTGVSGHLFISKAGLQPVLLLPNNFTKGFKPRQLLIAYARLLILSQSKKFGEYVKNGLAVWSWSSFEKKKIEQCTIHLTSQGSQKRLQELLIDMTLTDDLYNLPFESLHSGGTLTDAAVAKSFEAVGLKKYDAIKESLRAFSEEDESPIINDRLQQEVCTTIDAAWESHCTAGYVPDYLGFDSFKIVRPDSLALYLKRFGALLGVECSKL